jgi:hypothetical protein
MHREPSGVVDVSTVENFIGELTNDLRHCRGLMTPNVVASTLVKSFNRSSAEL